MALALLYRVAWREWRGEDQGWAQRETTLLFRLGEAEVWVERARRNVGALVWTIGIYGYAYEEDRAACAGA